MKSLTMSAISMIHFKILGMLGTVLLSVVTYPYKTEIKTKNELFWLKLLKILHVLCGGEIQENKPPYLSLHAASLAPFLAKELALPNWHMPKATFLSGMCVCVLLPLNTNGEQDLALWSGSYSV